MGVNQLKNLNVCLTSYHLLCACAIACSDSRVRNDLLFESFLDTETELVQKIRQCQIFDNIYYINQSNTWNFLKGIDYLSPNSKIKESVRQISEFWEEKFSSFKNIRAKYEEINIWSDHFSFGMALAYNRIPYNYFEESPGCHYRRDLFIKLSRQGLTNKVFAATSELYGLRGEYPDAVSYNYDFSLNPTERKSNDRDFSLTVLLKDLKRRNPAAFDKLKEIFASDDYFEDGYQNKIKPDKKNFLIIGQHYSSANFNNVMNIKYALSLLADYFGEDMNVLFKNHPSNYFNPMTKWFSNAVQVNSTVPTELIIADEAIRIDRAATLSSSAALSFKSSGTEIILFHNLDDNDSFESQKRFLDIHRYYIFAKSVEKIIKTNSVDTIYTYGVEPLMLEYIIKYQTNLSVNISALEDIDSTPLDKEDLPHIFLLDRISEEEQKNIKDVRKKVINLLSYLNKKDVVFFLNSDNSDIFFDADDVLLNENSCEYLYPMPIDIIDVDGGSELFGYGKPKYPLENTISKLRQVNYHGKSQIERQIIYMYSENKDTAKLVLSQSINKTLTNCGLSVKYSPSELNYREIIIDSMLDKLERQYLDAKNEISELKEDLNSVKLSREVDNKIRQLTEQIRVLTQLQNNNDLSNKIEAMNSALIERTSTIDEHLIRFSTLKGFKQRIKDKFFKKK